MWPRLSEVRYLLNGAFHGLAWGETGSPAAPPVICVHGLTGSGRDFDPLADALAGEFRVILPDLPGRGRSDWLDNPSLYHPDTYILALSHLLASIEQPVHWVGTGLGGVCGMMIAARPGNRIASLVLNDVGPHIPAAGLLRIRETLRQQWVFTDMAALARHLRALHAGFGRLGEAEWAHLARYSARALPDGRVTFQYDPAIAKPILERQPIDQHLWGYWDRIDVPRMVIRGEASDLLDSMTFARMEQGGAYGLTVPEAGHAPALMDARSIAAVRAFLLAV